MASTRRTSDDAPVEWKDAVAAWAAAGRPVLRTAATSYGAYLTYQQLASEVQQASGIETGVPFRHWIGQVLGAIATEQRSRPDEPILTAMVVRADGTIGDGYAIPVEERDGVVPDDLEMHAAQERLRCYVFFGAEVPADGGKPQLTSAVAARREKARRSAPAQPKPVCPGCFLQLPTSGVCDNCGS